MMKTITTKKQRVMKTAEFTINLGGNKVVFVVNRHYGCSDFSVTHNDEIICDGYQSDRRFYFSSMSKKVEFFQDVFEAKVIKSLKVLFKQIHITVAHDTKLVHKMMKTENKTTTASQMPKISPQGSGKKNEI